MRFFLFLTFHFFLINLHSQIKFPKNYFRSPVGIDLEISSNFGEIRPNHFHAGMDVSVQLKEGLNVYAVADGYVSRVKVSPRGYGNVIYVTHPNGYVSVYGHLSGFNKKIDDYIYNTQHDKQQFELDMYPMPDSFKVKKGDVIGKTGNSGRSYGAHLHFEIREQESEIPVNPLFAYEIKDKVAPKVNGIYMYRFGNEERKGSQSRQYFKRINGRTINTFGKVGFGLEIHDYISGNPNRFGVYQVDLYIDDSLSFSYQMNKISFYESRYLNSFIDYEERLLSNKKVTKCYIEPNNKLNIYKTSGSGLYDFSDGKLHTVKIVGKDIMGNTETIYFNVKSDPGEAFTGNEKRITEVKKINCFKEEEFSTKSFKIVFHRNCLYHDINLNYSTSNGKFVAYSKYHHIHNRYVPLHNMASIYIKPTGLPDKYKNKAMIAGLSKRGQIYSAGGKWKGDFIEAKINSFGTYFITVDTISPVINHLSLDKYQQQKGDKLAFKITDNLSGVEEYIGYIDDKRVLFEYDEKNNLVSCNLIKEKVAKGKHTIVLWVKDYCGNIASYESDFEY